MNTDEDHLKDYHTALALLYKRKAIMYDREIYRRKLNRFGEENPIDLVFKNIVWVILLKFVLYMKRETQ